MNELKLTKLERINLIHQLRILEALYPDEADTLAVQRESFERGYEMLYGWAFDYVYDGADVMSPDESKEVWDTMDMFDAIARAIKEHNPDLKGKPVVQFRGYDGNYEGKFMGFAEFTVERLDRFRYLELEKPGYWNSHAPMREIYNRMLVAWLSFPLERRFEMSPAELEMVLTAAIHPESR